MREVFEMNWLDTAGFSFVCFAVVEVDGTAFNTSSSFWLSPWILADLEKTNCPYSGAHQLENWIHSWPLFVSTHTSVYVQYVWACSSECLCVSACYSHCVVVNQWIVHDPARITAVNISKTVQSSIIASTLQMEYIYDLRPTLCIHAVAWKCSRTSHSFLIKEMCFFM